GAAHGAPEIEVAVVVAERRQVIGGRAEPGHDQQVATVAEQRPDGGTTVQHHSTQRLRPISRWPISTATASSPLKARSAAAATVSAADAASSTRCVMTSQRLRLASVMLPIGTWPGLNSARSLRLLP